MQVTLKRLAQWLGQTVIPCNAETIIVHGVAIDSRVVIAGNVFIALRGKKFDAHNFLAAAAARGAVAVIVEYLPINLGIPVFIVPDTGIALGKIARYWRQKFFIPVIAITGSNGKTTVKEMIATILIAAFGKNAILATFGNLNNKIGVPLTMLRLEKKHRVAVLELGMNHPGEIAVLADIIQPTVALINNAQREHQEFMITVEAVAREHSTIFRALPTQGIAIFPAEDPYACIWQHQLNQCNILLHNKFVFGFNTNANVSATYLLSSFNSKITVTTHINNYTHKFHINLRVAGQHNVLNALAAIACTLAINIDLIHVIRGLEMFIPVSGRLQPIIATNGTIIIDDTYNANPDSVYAAINVLAQQTNKPRVLVLGDMNEVGISEKKYYKDIGYYAYQLGIEYLFGFGKSIRYTVQAFNISFILNNEEARGQYYDIIEVINAALAQIVIAHASILIKGSRFMKMERIVQYLVKTYCTTILYN